jgi:hypothetical protein
MDLVPHDNDVIAVYELGVVFMDKGTSVRWKARFVQIDWFFDHVDDATIWFASEYGGNVGYRLQDGTKVISGDGS